MPEFAHLFIWYRAPRELEAELRKWLLLVEEMLDIKGELFQREDLDSEGNTRTTFMESYRNVDDIFITRLEALASRQPWHQNIQSPRRCEAFNRIE